MSDIYVIVTGTLVAGLLIAVGVIAHLTRKREIDPEKLQLLSEKGQLRIRYRITDEKQKALACGRIHLNKENAEIWRVDEERDFLIFTLEIAEDGSVGIREICKKFERMVT